MALFIHRFCIYGDLLALHVAIQILIIHLSISPCLSLPLFNSVLNFHTKYSIYQLGLSHKVYYLNILKFKKCTVCHILIYFCKFHFKCP